MKFNSKSPAVVSRLHLLLRNVIGVSTPDCLLCIVIEYKDNTFLVLFRVMGFNCFTLLVAVLSQQHIVPLSVLSRPI